MPLNSIVYICQHLKYYQIRLYLAVHSFFPTIQSLSGKSVVMLISTKFASCQLKLFGFQCSCNSDAYITLMTMGLRFFCGNGSPLQHALSFFHLGECKPLS